MLPIVTFLSYLLIVGVFAYVIVFGIMSSNNISRLENWLYVSSFRIIFSNYEWHHMVARKGVN